MDILVFIISISTTHCCITLAKSMIRRYQSTCHSDDKTAQLRYPRIARISVGHKQRTVTALKGDYTYAYVVGAISRIWLPVRPHTKCPREAMQSAVNWPEDVRLRKSIYRWTNAASCRRQTRSRWHRTDQEVNDKRSLQRFSYLLIRVSQNGGNVYFINCDRST